MMQLLTVIRKVLKDDPSVSAQAIGGVHTRRAPQGSLHRSVVVDHLTGTDDWTQKGPMNFHQSIIRVTCRTDYGDDQAEDLLSRAVYDLLQGYSSNDAVIYDVAVDKIFHRNTHDGATDDKAEIQRTIFDFEVRYRRS